MKEKHVIVHVTECNLLLVSYYQFATQRAAAGVSSKFEVATEIRGRADAFTNESKVPSLKIKNGQFAFECKISEEISERLLIV